MRVAWGADFERFAPRLTVSYADAENREEAQRMGTDVVVMNIDGVKWFTEKRFEKERTKILKDFDHLAIDEYTAYKHPTSQRSKAIARIRKHFTHRRAMSGTPNPNTVMELWHPSLLLDDGKRLGMSYYQLRSHLQAPTQIGPSANHLRWDDKPGANQVVHDLLSDITIRHAFEDVMTHVPPNHRDVKTFSLSARCKKAYDTMERDCLLAFESGAMANAVHAAALRTKLLQIASGAVYSGEEQYQLIDPQRYELIADLVDERDHSVVFFNWKHQRDYLAKEFEKRGFSFAIIDGNVKDSERDAIVNRYQAGQYQTLLLHPRTGAHGLTLTRGDTTIVSSPFYEADLLKQAIHRIYRGDQDKATNTILVQAKGTVEEKVYARLDDKYGRIIDLLDLMKRKL
jgi:SNF2 family DNA or RNA helicase